WHPDEQLFWFVSHGVAGTAMLGFHDRLGARDRWDVVQHLHVLASAPGATATRPPPVAAPGPPLTPAPLAAVAQPSSGTGPADEGARPSISGGLVFGPDFDNNLWLIRLPDGKPTPLTRLGPLEFASHPAWSPDGARLALSYYRLPGGDAIPVPDGTDLALIE